MHICRVYDAVNCPVLCMASNPQGQRVSLYDSLLNSMYIGLSDGLAAYFISPRMRLSVGRL